MTDHGCFSRGEIGGGNRQPRQRDSATRMCQCVGSQGRWWPSSFGCPHLSIRMTDPKPFLKLFVGFLVASWGIHRTASHLPVGTMSNRMVSIIRTRGFISGAVRSGDAFAPSAPFAGLLRAPSRPDGCKHSEPLMESLVIVPRQRIVGVCLFASSLCPDERVVSRGTLVI